MNLIKTLKNKTAQVDWMWIIIGVIIALLLLSLGLILVKKAGGLSDLVIVLFAGE